jgi:hypothetical protein
MNSVRYVGLDVHRDTISAAVLNEGGPLVQQSVPFLGPLRAAVLIGRVQTPHRFRTKRVVVDEKVDARQPELFPSVAVAGMGGLIQAAVGWGGCFGRA